MLLDATPLLHLLIEQAVEEGNDAAWEFLEKQLRDFKWEGVAFPPEYAGNIDDLLPLPDEDPESENSGGFPPIRKVKEEDTPASSKAAIPPTSRGVSATAEGELPEPQGGADNMAEKTESNKTEKNEKNEDGFSHSAWWRVGAPIGGLVLGATGGFLVGRYAFPASVVEASETPALVKTGTR